MKAWFSTPTNAVISTLLLVLVLWVGATMLPWATWNAVWLADPEACRAARGVGACWGVVAEKWPLILLGRYPLEEAWRAALACLLLTACIAVPVRAAATRASLVVAVACLLAALALLAGGFAGLAAVPTERWGGLSLTLLLAVVGNVVSLPLAALLALGRTSHLPLVRVVCTSWIELVRGVPLVTVLFMASFMFPLLLPSGFSPDVLLRVCAGLVIFSAAYQAEVIRGGIQSISPGQTEAAQALGLGYWQIQMHIVLPQALRVQIPALVNSFIALFKDTSLVTIVSLFELFGALRLALADPVWRAYFVEAFVFVALIYWVFCSAMSKAARRMESRA